MDDPLSTTPGLELYESYEQDYDQLSTSIVQRLGKLPDERGEPRNTTLRRIEMELEEADEIVAQMEVEVGTVPVEHRQRLQAALKGCRSSLTGWRSDLKIASQQSAREELLGSAAVDPPRSSSPSLAAAQAQRQSLMTATDKLTDGQRRLEESHRVALETEDLGAGILRDLVGQRGTIERTREHLYEADGAIDRASGMLNKMITRMYQQRATTWAIVGVLVILILYVLYSKLFG